MQETKTIKIYKSIKDNIRKNPSYDERWGTFEVGLVTAWESGRLNRDSIYKDIVSHIENGALPKLCFKGGHKMPFDCNFITYKKPKYKFKYGVFNYLAELQGIQNQDLDITIDGDMELICKLTGLKTILTLDSEKYKNN